MWLLPVTRRELIDLITPRRSIDVPGTLEEHRPSFDAVRADKMAAVWPAPPAEIGRMPTMIVVPEGMHRDTLAWVSTYLRDFRPFTAYCRVVERSIAEQFMRGPGVPTLLGIEGICAGLILGEALMHTRGRTTIVDLPTTAYSATLSSAIARALALTGGAFSLDAIVDLWTQAREMTGQNGLAVPPNSILSVWAVALGAPSRTAPSRTLFEPADILAEAWSEVSSAGEMRDPVWHRLVEGFPDLFQMRNLLKVPREQRVQAIDVALRILSSSKRADEERRGFLAGYFTSLLGPGTLDHADFLAPMVSAFPTAYLWYGMFAGSNPRGDALPMGSPPARRIVRNLTIPDRLIDRPRCDVALEELAIHGAIGNLVRQTAKTGSLDIDILPGVSIAVRWPPHEPSGEDEFRRARDIEVQHLLTDMAEASVRTRDLAERLREVMGKGRDRQQPDKKKRPSRA